MSRRAQPEPGRIHARARKLAQDAADGDRGAQQELIGRVLPHLRAVARAMFGRGAEADDAMQTAAIKILGNAGSYRGEASLERWARRVGTRVCLDALRKRRHASEVDPAELDALPAESQTTDASDGLPHSLRAYLDRLPAAQREAIVLRHVLGHTVAEVAEDLGVPVDTVKSRLLYGRRALRKFIRQDHNVGDIRKLRGESA